MAIDRTKLTKQAEGYLSSGRPAKAINIFLELLEDNPKDLSLANKIGDLYLQVDGQSEAAAMFKRAAIGFEEDGFLHKAIAVFKKALRTYPEDTEVAVRLADLYKRIKMPKDAIQVHIQLADAFSKKGDFQRALKELAEVASLDPRNIKNKIRLAELFANEGMKEQAEKVFLESAETLATENMPLEAAQILERAKSIGATAQVFLTQFRISVIQKDYEGAIGHLDEGLNAYPQNADLLGAKAQALIQVQQPLDALKVFTGTPALPEAALTTCEKALSECHTKGLTREGLEAFAPAALEAAKRGLGWPIKRTLHNALNPQGDNALADYWLLQAEVARHGGFQEDCVESLKYALGLMESGDSRLDTVRKDLHDLGIGDADMAATAPPNLMKHDKSAPTLPPELASQVKQLTSEGELHESKAMFDKAIEAYQGVLGIDPTNSNAIDRIAEIHKASGMVTKAQTHYCAAAEKIASLGELELAVHYLDKAEALMPGSTRVYRLTLGLLDAPAADAPPAQSAVLDETQSQLSETEPSAAESVDLPTPNLPEEKAQPTEEPVSQNELDGLDLAPTELPSTSVQAQEETREQTEQIEQAYPQQEDIGEEVEQTEQIEQPEQPEPQAEQQEDAEEESGQAEQIEQSEQPEPQTEQQEGTEERADETVPPQSPKDLVSSIDLSEMLDPLLNSPQSAEVLNDDTKTTETVQTAEELFNTFREGVAAKVGGDDYDTHYSLGIAYKEMMLADPAIEEFKKAMVDPERTLECCSMLAMCERMKGDNEAAANWLRIGIAAPGFPPIDSNGLRLDLAALLEEMGHHDESEALLQETRNLENALLAE